jgi:hypothetical protein
MGFAEMIGAPGAAAAECPPGSREFQDATPLGTLQSPEQLRRIDSMETCSVPNQRKNPKGCGKGAHRATYRFRDGTEHYRPAVRNRTIVVGRAWGRHGSAEAVGGSAVHA